MSLTSYPDGFQETLANATVIGIDCETTRMQSTEHKGRPVLACESCGNICFRTIAD